MTVREKLAAMSAEEKNRIFDLIKDTETTEQAAAKLAESGIEITADALEALVGEARKAGVHEMSDDELDTVSAGLSFYKVVSSENPDDISYIFNIGDIVEVYVPFGFGTTVRCHIKERRIAPNALLSGEYVDEYYCEEIEPHWYFVDSFVTRDWIQFGSLQRA